MVVQKNRSNNIFHEIRDFLFNKNIVNFAVATIFSNTFYPIIMSLVNEIIIPLLSLVFSNIKFIQHTSVSINGINIVYGNVLKHLSIFILSMAILFFLFIKPSSEIILKQEEQERKYKEKNQKKILNSVNKIEDYITKYKYNILF